MADKILVIIPALNAELTLPSVLRGVLAHASRVVVINDGSTDRTGEVARDEGAMVLRHDVNRGKGAALKTGFKYALDNGYDAVISLDADGQHLPSEIPKFLAEYSASRADLIIGGRAHLFHEMLPRRRNANRFSAWAISKASGLDVPDSQSGFRLYAAGLLETLPIRANGFSAESEIIVRAGRAGMRVVTIPINLGFTNGISTSHYRPVLDTVRIAAVVARTRFLG